MLDFLSGIFGCVKRACMIPMPILKVFFRILEYLGMIRWGELFCVNKNAQDRTRPLFLRPFDFPCVGQKDFGDDPHSAHFSRVTSATFPLKASAQVPKSLSMR